MAYRIIAQDILSGEILNWNVPLTEVSVQYTLSGPCVITGKLKPEDPNLNVEAMEAWSTWMHLELDGRIMASGILQPVELNGVELTIECEGPTGYAHGIIWDGTLSEIHIDPIDVARRIWTHVQSYPRGNLGLKVDTTSKTDSSRFLGRTAEEEKTKDNPDAKAAPYELEWWDHKDCGDEVNNLAKAAPFDYLERCQWNADKTSVEHYLDFGYPRVGRFRDDLRFADGLGENIVSAIPLVEIDDSYASEVICLGAGEGSAMIRGRYSGNVNNRLRRTVVISDATITTVDRANEVAKQEWNRRAARYSYQKITVDASHPNAQLGTFSVGDDISVTGLFPWVGRMTINHRITAYTWSPDSSVVEIDLAPSDSFNYGPPLS